MLCNNSVLRTIVIVLCVFLCVCACVCFRKEKNHSDLLPGIGYAKSRKKDDNEGEAQGDFEKVTEDITMRCHLNDFNTRAALQ